MMLTKTKSILEVYDPVMCCSTGVCGPDVDDELADFANDVKWLKAQGVDVNRYNLGQEPEAFKKNAAILEKLKKAGTEVLPIMLINGEIVSEGGYPDRKKLSEWLQLSSHEENGVSNHAELLRNLEKTVSDGNQSGIRNLFHKGIENGLSIEALAGAMQSGIDNRQKITRRTLQTANELLGVQPGGCSPGSGCC